VGRTVPALNALHGKRDLKTPIAIPTLDALGPADKATARIFMDKIFHCNIERFMEGGDLHIVKETFLASLLMHHRNLMTDCGPLNRVSDMLLDKARGCVTCAESPSLPADKVLENWCDKIKSDFKQKSSINELKVVATTDQPAYEMIASMADSIKSLTKTVADLNEGFDGAVKKNGEQAATISALHEKNASLQQEVDELSMMVARRSQQMAASPEGGRSNKRQRVSTAVDVASFDLEADTAIGASETSRSGSPVPPHAALPNTTAVNTTATTTTATNPATAPAPAPSPTVTTAATPQHAPPQPPQPLPIRHGHVAEQQSKKKSMKNNDLRDHLAALAQSGAFQQHSKLAKGYIPARYCEKSLVGFCLELVDYVAERNEDVGTR
jgi:hypothetical protein